MKPFLFLATRDHPQAADEEYQLLRDITGLTDSQLQRLRVESAPIPNINLDDYSGILVPGSQFTTSVPNKTATQIRVERELQQLGQQVFACDFPLLGICYGVGVMTLALGGVVDGTYGEPVGAVAVSLTAAGRKDPLLECLPSTFPAFVIHKEACTRPPTGAVILATGQACPVQMYRMKSNLYLAQFHPELDAEALIARMTRYQHEGYFAPTELAGLIAGIRAADVGEVPQGIIRAFIKRYARD